MRILAYSEQSLPFFGRNEAPSVALCLPFLLPAGRRETVAGSSDSKVSTSTKNGTIIVYTWGGQLRQQTPTQDTRHSICIHCSQWGYGGPLSVSVMPEGYMVDVYSEHFMLRGGVKGWGCSFLSAKSRSCGVIKFLKATTSCTHRDAICNAVAAHGCPGHEWRSSITPERTCKLLKMQRQKCCEQYIANEFCQIQY